MYSIYNLSNNYTGMAYVGYTGRSMEQRLDEHFTQTIKKPHKFGASLRANPAREDWHVELLWQTPLYPEARAMEAAFIYEMAQNVEVYNTVAYSNRDLAAQHVAGCRLMGLECKSLYSYKYHQDSRTWLYRRAEQTWKFGHHGVDKWVEWDSGEMRLEDAENFIIDWYNL